jgi:hypothetical protein
MAPFFFHASSTFFCLFPPLLLFLKKTKRTARSSVGFPRPFDKLQRARAFVQLLYKGHGLLLAVFFKNGQLAEWI